MRKNIIATLSLVALLLPAAARSNTITVMKDGSGDYTLLQPAADAAAAGDTLLIGPGRYEEVTEFAFNSGVPRDAHLVVRVDNLTIIGMDRDSVIIGPSVPAIAQGDPVGLVVAENVNTTHIEKLTFENTWVGAYTLGDFYADDCVARFCDIGILTEGPITISRSTIQNNVNDGVLIGAPAGPTVISHCEVLNNATFGISVLSPNEAQITDTHIAGGKEGIQFNNTPGVVSNCVIENIQYGGITLIESGTVVTIADNTLRNNGWHFDINSYATVDMHQTDTDSGLYTALSPKSEQRPPKRVLLALCSRCDGHYEY